MVYTNNHIRKKFITFMSVSCPDQFQRQRENCNWIFTYFIMNWLKWHKGKSHQYIDDTARWTNKAQGPSDFFAVLFYKSIWYLKSCFALKEKVVINQLSKKKLKLLGESIYEWLYIEQVSCSVIQRTYLVVVVEFSFFSRNFHMNVMFHFSRGMSHQCYGLYWKSYRCYVQQSTYLLRGLFFFESFWSIFLDRILIYRMRMVKSIKQEVMILF